MVGSSDDREECVRTRKSIPPHPFSSIGAIPMGNLGRLSGHVPAMFRPLSAHRVIW